MVIHSHKQLPSDYPLDLEVHLSEISPSLERMDPRVRSVNMLEIQLGPCEKEILKCQVPNQWDLGGMFFALWVPYTVGSTAGEGPE